MSTKAEEFAKQLLEKTESGKLKWQLIPDPETEIYKADAEDGISFIIKRKARGDDKIVALELADSGRLVLSDLESNFPTYTFIQSSPEPVDAFLDNVSRNEKIRRFRLFSDLFYAAVETAQGGDQAIQKAQRFLARLA